MNKRGRGSSTPLDEQAKEKFKRNLIELMLVNSTKQVDIVSKTGIPKSTLNGYVKGNSLPNAGNLQKLADYFGVKKSRLDPRYKNTDIVNINDNTEFVNIPILGNIACGEPILAEENIEGYKKRLKEDLPTGELFYLVAQGDSMSPIIPDKSLVLCRAQANVENGEIAAVLLNSDADTTLKKVRKLSGMVILEPINKDFEPIVINKDNPARIIGKAIEYTAKI